MEQVQLGGTGLKVSQVCLGMMSYGDAATRPWVLDEDASRPLVRQAAEAGITFFDTADVYSAGVSEEFTGRLLREVFSRREEYVIATKVCGDMGTGPNGAGLSRGHILDAVDASLRRLGTDHIDLYQIHSADPTTPIAETMGALDDVVRAGKVRYIGASNLFAWELALAQHAAERANGARFVTMQHHYNLLYREEEREMIGYLRHESMGSLPWSPLGRGRLARAGRPAETARTGTDDFGNRLYEPVDAAGDGVLDAVAAVAGERGVAPAQVALAWLLHQPIVTAPIVGATKAAHIDDAVAATELQLSAAELERLEAPYVTQPVLKPGALLR